MMNTCLFALALSFAGAEAAPAPRTDVVQIERNMVTYTNAERQRHGLPPLALDPALLRSARSHASWMASTRSLVHTSAGVAENIAMGQRSSLDAVRDWMQSSGHRANILSRSHTRVGAAAYVSSGGTIYWCLQLQ